MQGRGKRIGFGVLMVCLALMCVGFCELVVCRVEDPQLYASLTAPVRRLCLFAGQQVEAMTWELSQSAPSRRWERRELAYRHYRPDWPEPEEPVVEEPEAPELPPMVVIPEETPVTELLWNDGLEILTGGTLPFVYFNQKDEAWAECRFGRDPVGRFGCGPTAMSILVSSLTGETVTPEAMAEWTGKAGYAAPGSGAYLSIVEGVARHYSLSCESVKMDSPEQLLEELSQGNLFVALMGKGHFTARGHFIILRGATLTGEVLLADPNSRDNSLQLWDPQIILDELSRSQGNGAPLWRFPVPQPGRAELPEA